MSEPEKFLDRWSRRKRDAAEMPAPAEAKPAAATPSPDSAAKEKVSEPAFDPASLPPIESIGADSDIAAFLKPGVPPELTRAALRRAWSADPAIRDFIGLIENPWDFNDPHAVPGFGPMPAGEDIGRLLAQAIGERPAAETDAPRQVAQPPENPNENRLTRTDLPSPQQLSDAESAPDQGLAAVAKDPVQRSEEDTAMQNNSGEAEGSPPSRRRGHGGALPK